MSSMLRKTAFLTLALFAATSVPARCEDGGEWDRARAQLVAGQGGSMGQAIERWRLLTSSDRFQFADYAGFLLSYPGFPDEAKLRAYAEKALETSSADSGRLIAFFDRFKPVTNPARAQYALALSALRRPEARQVAIEAWRGGPMSEAAMAALFASYGPSLRPEDHDARMNALLWAGDTFAAQQQIGYVSPASRSLFAARLALIQGQDPASAGIQVSGDAVRDAGYVYNRVRRSRTSGNLYGASNLLATRPPATVPPLDTTRWIGEHLAAARGAGADTAVRIAAAADDAFPPGTEVSRQSFKVRDDYTSLMWLGGTKALWSLGDTRRAAPLFYRYGAAARSPQTRAKGFYWAGRAAQQGGDGGNATRYFELAAQYPEQFYGMLSLERLGRAMPNLNTPPSAVPTAEERSRFNSRPIVAAVREVARGYDWQTGIKFYREIADQAQTPGEHMLVADLARAIGRRDLAVIGSEAAEADGILDFQTLGFPLIPAPAGANWTMVHAITRQESQFAQNAVSHAGARGLMQLMPGTAREQAGKIGLAYDSAALIQNPAYNIRLGDAYFARMMDNYGGSYPLAVAAYNAGPGNVNRWLRENGDPRYGSIDWIQWIEKIPLQETRNYVQRVLENAVVYEAMNPGRASYRGPNPLSHFLGKRSPG